MQQQLARTSLRVTELAGRRIGADVDALQRRLAILDAHVGVAQVGFMRAQRLDLGADQRETGLEGFLDKEIVARLLVVDDEFESVILRARGLSLHLRHSMESNDARTRSETSKAKIKPIRR